MKVQQSVIRIVARNCGIRPASRIKRDTPFMDGQSLSYYQVMDVMFDVEHKCGIKLPEHEYATYGTVGLLIDAVKRKRQATK